MVDSLLDNLTLRTHRRSLLNLELRSHTSHENLHGFILATEQLLKRRKEVETFNVVFTDITKDALVVQVEFLIAAISQEEFNAIKQDINLSIIQTLEQMKIRLASRETEITLADKPIS